MSGYNSPYYNQQSAGGYYGNTNTYGNGYNYNGGYNGYNGYNGNNVNDGNNYGYSNSNNNLGDYRGASPYGGGPLNPSNTSPVTPKYQQPYPPSQNASFTSSTVNASSASKPLYDPKDPSAPRPPEKYGSKDTIYADVGSPLDEKKKYGGFMGTFCCSTERSCAKICGIICCILFLIIVAIVVAILLWAKEPQITFMGIGSSPNGLPLYVPKTLGFDFNFGLNISVDNPNIVGATFKQIKAVAFYPNHTQPIGGGNLTNVDIGARKNTTIDFPFSVNYDASIDPGFGILLDIVQKCGLTGGQKQKLQIDYQLTLAFKVLLITVSPSFRKTAQIDCPIQNGQLPNIPGFNLGGSLPSTFKNI